IHLADPVAAEIAYHTVAFTVRNGLNGITNIAQGRARPYRANARCHRFIGGVDQALDVRLGLADEVHATGIAKPAVLDHRDIDIVDIASLQHLVRRYAVAHLMVDRGADGFWKAVIAHVVRDRLLHVDDIVMAYPVEIIGGQT